MRTKSIGMLLIFFFSWSLIDCIFASQLRKQGTATSTRYEMVSPIRLETGNSSTATKRSIQNTVSYSFSGFNRYFVLDLEPIDFLLHPGFHVLTFLDDPKNSTVMVDPGYHLKECFYRGQVRDDLESFVSLSTCRGLLGLIHTRDGDFRIEPNSLGNSSISHRLYSITNGSTEYIRNNIPLRFSRDAIFSNGGRSASSRTRSTRSVSQEWNLEMLLVADSKMKRYHGDNLEMYILTLMASVALIFKDPSIGNNINISVVKLIIMEDGQDTGIIFPSASKTLRNFCRWQYMQNDPSYPLSSHDTAILLTREDLCRQTKTCDTLGLAQSGMVCDRYSSCAVVEDNGLSAAFTIAHELGHILGIPHDDDVKCSRYQEQNQRLHIMARMLDYHSHPWSWSECSRHYITSFLDAGYANCLLNKSTKDKLIRFPYSGVPPGELYDMDYQCELVFGAGSKICPYMPVCKRLWCTMEDVAQGGCRTQHMPWADGTKCAPDKSCHHGECILDSIEENPPRDGQWGEWQEFGPCSRSCGGGVSRSIRDCNSPRPKNGGRYCVGDRIRYASCNTQECAPGSIDFREEQCSAFNGKTFGFSGIEDNVVWQPHFTEASREMCKLYCRAANTAAYFLLKEKVIDGTACGSDTFDICVNGKCMPAGCDHKLYSKQVPDACGICGGDGSTCKVVHGNYVKVQYGYNPVVIVPAGASNIEILQFSHVNMKDDNYLALMDHNKTYILNGDYMISMFPKTLYYAGAVLEYSGSDTIVERINASKQLQKNLYVQVLTVGSLHPPSVSFNYTVSVKDQVFYIWRLEENWSPCNSICQGEQYRKAVCIDKVDERVVSDGHCYEQERLSHSARVCNTECYLNWEANQVTQCSSACGKGILLYEVKCIQRMESGNKHEIPDQFCAHIEPRPSKMEQCVGPCNITNWKYGEWSQCSVSCGNGMQFRTAKCLGNGIIELPDSDCSNDTKIITQICTVENCPEWVVGEWQKCSSSCGKGKRHRSHWCKQNHEIVSNNLCNESTVPLHIEECTSFLCYSWHVGSWESCSVSCGLGQMKRKVHCQSNDSKILDDYQCSEIPKPSESKSCELLPCLDSTDVSTENLSRTSKIKVLENMVPSFHIPNKGDSVTISTSAVPMWKAGAWSMCSVTCGEGTMRRLVVCHNPSSGGVLPDVRCNADERLPHFDVCNLSFCGRWSSAKWSECSSSCGEGIQTRNVVCVLEENEKVDEKLCDFSSRPSKEQLCYSKECPNLIPDLFPSTQVFQNSVENAYYWRIGFWGKCSKPCGGGIRRRQVVCHDESEQNSTHCNLKTKPADSVSCNVDRCPDWDIGSWSQCSTTCGVGIQKRHVRCINYKDQIVPNGRCAAPMPDREKKCKMPNCLHWSWSAWSECSNSCGVGRQKRTAVCQRGRRIENNEICDFIAKPQPQIRECNGVKCKFNWRKKEWSKCSTTCGKGHKYREVYCSNGANITVPDHFCHHKSKPQLKRRCHQHLCTMTWKASHWSECSKTCNNGVQTRSVTCHQVNSYQWIDPQPVSVPENRSSLTWCNSKDKPSEIRNCSLGSCHGNTWKPGSWSQCSVACGIGRQKRKVYCQNAAGKKLANIRCERRNRPQKRRKCYIRSCSAVNCLDYQKRGNITKDSEQEIFIHGKQIKVFCSGMNTSNPKEYITLTRGESENYSEIYDKRLINPNSCPYRGSRYDSCPCVSDQSVGSGRTIFHRIGINVSSLQVHAHDFKFSLTDVGQPVAYGESGDCYSMLDCPQGRFSLSLLGTGFIVSPVTKWITQGNYASSKVRWLEKGQVIQGKCGGYCGKCVPDPKIGLVLDVAPP